MQNSWANLTEKMLVTKPTLYLPPSRKFCVVFLAASTRVPILPEYISSGRVWPSAEGSKLFTSSFLCVWSEAQKTLRCY